MRLFDWAHRIDLRSEIQEIFVHRFLFKLAMGSVAIFLPLYVHQLGYGPEGVFLFFMLYFAVFIAASLPLSYVVARFGYKRSSLLAAPLLLGFYIWLRMMETAGPMVFLAAVLGGLGFNLYWMGMNSEMARNSHAEDRGAETGVFFSMPALAAVIAPFFGGTVIAVYGFEALFLLGATVMGASFVPFIFSDEHFEGGDHALSTVFNREHLSQFLTFFFQGVTSIGKMVLWPLYLALVVGGALNIGGAGSVMALGGAAVSVLIGKEVDGGDRFTVLAVGGLVFGFTWFAMSFITTPVQAFVISFINGMVAYTVRIPIYTEVIEDAEKSDLLEYFAFR
ncbi:MAG: MFS transporter, partial [Candidatus Nanohaloarchaea archaeon]|nr:MFS transporter [Candidatus Nanohaloarchaea archaeon]